MRRPTATRLLALALCGTLVGAGTAGLAVGQEGGGGRRSGERSDAGGGDAPREERGPSESAEPDAPAGTDDDVSASSSFAEGEGGSKVKVMEFSGLDITGRLKSPQLLYFLNRVRAEFDRPRLPHRSFMPELKRSTKSRAF